MNKTQKARLEKAGWTVGTPTDLLGLTPAEAALVEAKLELGDLIRAVRLRRGLSQVELARLMGSSQSRVAKLELRDSEATLDLQLRALFAADPRIGADFRGLLRKWAARAGR
jgi:hypothetical protein